MADKKPGTQGMPFRLPVAEQGKAAVVPGHVEVREDSTAIPGLPANFFESLGAANPIAALMPMLDNIQDFFDARAKIADAQTLSELCAALATAKESEFPKPVQNRIEKLLTEHLSEMEHLKAVGGDAK